MRLLGGLARSSEEHFAFCVALLPPSDAVRLLVTSSAAGCWSMASAAAMSAAKEFHALRVSGALDDLSPVRVGAAEGGG